MATVTRAILVKNRRVRLGGNIIYCVDNVSTVICSRDPNGRETREAVFSAKDSVQRC